MYVYIWVSNYQFVCLQYIFTHTHIHKDTNTYRYTNTNTQMKFILTLKMEKKKMENPIHLCLTEGRKGRCCCVAWVQLIYEYVETNASWDWRPPSQKYCLSQEVRGTTHFRGRGRAGVDQIVTDTIYLAKDKSWKGAEGDGESRSPQGRAGWGRQVRRPFKRGGVVGGPPRPG